MSSSYLVPGTSADGTQLWVVTVNDNGTASSQELVDFYPGSTSSAFAPINSPIVSPYFTKFDNGVLFVAEGLANETYGSPAYGSVSASGVPTGQELWYTDGTAAGTHLVYDNSPGTAQVYDNATYKNVTVGNSGIPSGSADILALSDTTALFASRSGTSKYSYLFATTGAAGNESQITTDGLYRPAGLTLVNGVAVFTAAAKAGGYNSSYVFVSDGTNAGTREVGSGADSNLKTVFTTAGGGQEALFVTADSQLWETNGTTATQLTTGADVSAADPFINLGNGTVLFFSGSDLWSTNGTPGGTQLVTADVVPGGVGPVFKSGTFTNAGGATEGVFAVVAQGGGYSLWASDGTANGTAEVGTSTSDPFTAAVGDQFVFTSTNLSGAQQLNVTNGTVAGTSVLETQYVTKVQAGPTGEAVFTETDASGAVTLFITDGTAGGTHAITTPGLTYFDNYTVDGNEFFFTAKDASGAYGLWEVGTTGDATLISLNGDGVTSAPSGLSVVGSDLFLNAATSTGTTESWVVSGTQATLATGGAVLTAGSAATSFTQVLPCFLAGTRLRAPHGEVAVETLREGDLLLTASGAAVPVTWIGQREVDIARHPAPARVRPVRIRRGAFGDNLPARDLLVSPDHAVLIDGALIPAALLIDGVSVAQEAHPTAHYFHVELPMHDVLLAEGLAVESYLDTGNRDCFEAADGVTRLHPDFWALHWDNACAPLVLSGPRLAAARALLRDRAAMRAAA
jgi:ELWxxDGT repeat protein